MSRRMGAGSIMSAFNTLPQAWPLFLASSQIVVFTIAIRGASPLSIHSHPSTRTPLFPRGPVHAIVEGLGRRQLGDSDETCQIEHVCSAKQTESAAGSSSFLHTPGSTQKGQGNTDSMLADEGLGERFGLKVKGGGGERLLRVAVTGKEGVKIYPAPFTN